MGGLSGWTVLFRSTLYHMVGLATDLQGLLGLLPCCADCSLSLSPLSSLYQSLFWSTSTVFRLGRGAHIVWAQNVLVVGWWDKIRVYHFIIFLIITTDGQVGRRDNNLPPLAQLV